jgi:hypothetical protein
MKEYFRFILVLVLVVVLCGLGLWLRRKDPDFHGKPESFWINNLTNHGRLVFVTDSAGGTRLAFPTWQGFGSEGVPLLVKALNKGTGPWDRFYFKLWPKLPSSLSGWLPKPVDESGLRIYSMLILHTMASDAQIAVPALVQALHDENAGVRQSALSTLGVLLPGMGQEKIRIFPRVLKAARDGAPGVRNNAVIFLGYYRDQASIVAPVVVNALHDSDPLVRFGAISSLMRLGATGANEAAVPALLQLLQDGNAEVREAATNALTSIAPEAAAKAGIK